MKLTTKHSKLILVCLAAIATIAPAMAQTTATNKGVAVALPWVYSKGNDTARTLAVTSVEEIARKAQYSSIPGDVAQAAWEASKLPTPSYGHLPTRASLKAFGKAVKASKVLYGSISWHTRSIWVNLGPKTISTATIDAYVFDVASGKVVYQAKGVKGRSDEKSNGYKIAADILITPLVTAVSGGPATPQEQRAVQIGLALAYQAWTKRK